MADEVDQRIIDLANRLREARKKMPWRSSAEAYEQQRRALAGETRPPMIRRKDTDESRRFWESAESAAKEVESSPSWKKGSISVGQSGVRGEGVESSERVCTVSESDRTSEPKDLPQEVLDALAELTPEDLEGEAFDLDRFTMWLTGEIDDYRE